MLRTTRTPSVDARAIAHSIAMAFGPAQGVVCIDALGTTLGRTEPISPARNRFARRWPR